MYPYYIRNIESDRNEVRGVRYGMLRTVRIFKKKSSQKISGVSLFGCEKLGKNATNRHADALPDIQTKKQTDFYQRLGGQKTRIANGIATVPYYLLFVCVLFSCIISAAVPRIIIWPYAGRRRE